MKKVKQMIFLSILFLSCISYVFYFYFSYKNGFSTLWTFSTMDAMDVPVYAKEFTFLKDILCVVLFIFLINKVSKKIIISLIFILIVGFLSGVISGSISLSMIIAGIRNLIYFFVVFMFSSSEYNDDLLRYKVTKIIKLLIYIQLIVVIIQFILSKSSIYSIGKGGYRFMGLFGNAGSLSMFAIAALIYLVIISQLDKTIKMKELLIYELLLFVLIYFTGSRMGIIISLFTIILTIIQNIKINDTIKIILTGISCIFFIPGIIKFSESYAERGSILEAQVSGGRIRIIMDFFNQSSIIQSVLGAGIGYGTNTAYNMGNLTPIMDGTFNSIITQFGLVGLTVFIIIMFSTMIKINKLNKDIKFFCLFFELILLIILVTGNIFEQISFIIIFTYLLVVLLQRKNPNKN